MGVLLDGLRRAGADEQAAALAARLPAAGMFGLFLKQVGAERSLDGGGDELSGLGVDGEPLF